MSTEPALPQAAPYRKHEIIKEDGRLLTYYEFVDDSHDDRPGETTAKTEAAPHV